MTSLSLPGSYAIVALTLLPLVFASPLSLRDTSALKARKFDSWHDCSKEQQTKLEQDFKDAAMFADYAAKNMDKDSNAYVHVHLVPCSQIG
jgi:hypothetical protein